MRACMCNMRNAWDLATMPLGTESPKEFQYWITGDYKKGILNINRG